jgi:hypothetical protein
MLVRQRLLTLSLLSGVALTSAILSVSLTQQSALACGGSALDPGWGDCYIRQQQQQYQQEIINENIRQQYEQSQIDNSSDPFVDGTNDNLPERNSRPSFSAALTGLLKARLGTLQNLLVARQAFEAKYGKLLFEGDKGVWLMSGTGDGTGKACDATFIPATASSFVTVFGPNQQLPGYFLFHAPTIPATDKPKEIRMVLSTNDATPATVQAIVVPLKNKSSVIIMPTDMITTMRGTTETTWITLQLDGKEVFRTNMAGIMAARDAMLKCMKA